MKKINQKKILNSIILLFLFLTHHRITGADFFTNKANNQKNIIKLNNIDGNFKNYKKIILNSTQVEYVDKNTILWGKHLLNSLSLKKLSIEARAKKIMAYVHETFVFNWKRPENIAAFIKDRSGNCNAHSRLGIFLLRLAEIPAKFAYEIHLELKSNQALTDAAKFNTGVFGHYHNDHLWVLFFDGKNWVPYDSTQNLLGFEDFQKIRVDRKTEVLGFIPFVIWEDMGTGTDNMKNITEYIWNRLATVNHLEITSSIWNSFVKSFYKVDVNLFKKPLKIETINKIGNIGKLFFNVPKLAIKKANPALIEYLNKLEKDKYNYYINEMDMNKIGYGLLKKKQIKTAIEIFKLNTQFFPNSFNVYDSLGEVYFLNKQYKKSKENYQRSLKLNPKNLNAKKMLKKISN